MKYFSNFKSIRDLKYMYHFFMEGEGAYIIGRVAALSCKPAILISANYLAGKKTASVIAIMFVYIPIAIAISAFDSHRGFYQCYFTTLPRQRVKESFKIYVNSLFFQILALTIPLFVYIYWQFEEIILAIVAILYFSSERLADETQRFLIFKGSRAEWGNKIFLKVCIQIIGSALVCVIFAGDNIAIAASSSVLALAMGNAIPYMSYIPWSYLPKRWSIILSSWHQCWDNIGFWILSSATAVISYLDRICIMIFHPTDMAIFTLIVSSLSLIQNAMEYFFFTIKRRDILQSKISLRAFLSDRQMHAIVLISASVGLILCLIIIITMPSQTLQYGAILPSLLIIQIALALCLIVREIIYWKHNVSYLIRVELVYILTVGVSLLFLRLADMSYPAALGVIAGLLLGRLLVMFKLAS